MHCTRSTSCLLLTDYIVAECKLFGIHVFVNNVQLKKNSHARVLLPLYENNFFSKQFFVHCLLYYIFLSPSKKSNGYVYCRGWQNSTIEKNVTDVPKNHLPMLQSVENAHTLLLSIFNTVSFPLSALNNHQNVDSIW